jgi:DeoR/GlpR family transcriptional regulator of sugar metabolism
MTATPSPRARQILDLLAGGDEVAVADLAERFGVTETTIRRDLDALERDGRVTRTHGGAILAARAVVSFAFADRQRTRSAEKRAIAAAAARRIAPGATVILDTGTTTLELARILPGAAGLKVLTSSLAIAAALQGRPDLELVLLGGTVGRGSPDLGGPLTVENLAAFRADLAFIGADAADRHGLYTDDQRIADVSRAMIGSATKVVLVADSGKFGRTAFVRFATWRTVDAAIVDDGLGAGPRRWLRRQVDDVELVTAADAGRD